MLSTKGSHVDASSSCVDDEAPMDQDVLTSSSSTM